MKTMLFLLPLLALPNLSAHAYQAPDAKGAKLRIQSVANAEMDCKVSRKEIKKLKKKNGHERHLCSQLTGTNLELSFSELVDLIHTGAVRFDYEGLSDESLEKLFSKWREALLDLAQNQILPVEMVEPWSFIVLSRDGDITTMRITNSATNEMLSFEVQMGQELKKKVSAN